MSFETPLVFRDTQQDQSLSDVFHALRVLSTTVDQVFERIGKRADDEAARLSSVNGRISTANTKIATVASSRSKLPTIVYSTAKYTAAKKLPDFTSLYHDRTKDDGGVVHPESEDDVVYQLAERKVSPLMQPDVNASMTSIWSRLNPHGTDMVREEMLMEDEGLARLPAYLPSVGSMLLFNSTKTPYKTYSTGFDNLMHGDSKEQEDEGAKDLHAAPDSVLHGLALPDLSDIDYEYRPGLGEMNNLDLPTNLPLPDIADMSYGGGPDGTPDLPTIAPSAFQNQDMMLALPPIEDFGSIPSAKEPATAPQAGGPDAANPPPPPPPPGAPPPPPPTSAPPPPPPPPPPLTVARLKTSSTSFLALAIALVLPLITITSRCFSISIRAPVDCSIFLIPAPCRPISVGMAFVSGGMGTSTCSGRAATAASTSACTSAALAEALAPSLASITTAIKLSSISTLTPP
mmetsp:Transcript_11472/g.24046  ORF Transcript_11472/g.24046 Transcript_11472/m.24046 type:complete len:460 (-) Transcript_11472:387-1766(-)